MNVNLIYVIKNKKYLYKKISLIAILILYFILFLILIFPFKNYNFGIFVSFILDFDYFLRTKIQHKNLKRNKKNNDF